MYVRQCDKYVTLNVGWLLTSVLGLVLFDALNYETFFVSGLVGFLVVSQLAGPLTVEPEWRRRGKYVAWLATAAFFLVILRRIATLFNRVIA